MIIRFEEVGRDALDQATKLLAGVDGGIEKAIRNAMTRATSHLRTNSTKKIREVYAISSVSLRTDQNVQTKYRYSPGSGVSASVIFRGSKIPLYRYDGASPAQPAQDKSRTVNAIIQGNWRKTHPSVNATGHQLRSTSPTRFGGAFVARMQSGHVGIFERTGGVTASGSDALKELMGSSVPQMLGNKKVEESLASGAMQKFEERLDHEVMVLLGMR